MRNRDIAPQSSIPHWRRPGARSERLYVGYARELLGVGNFAALAATLREGNAGASRGSHGHGRASSGGGSRAPLEALSSLRKSCQREDLVRC